MITENSTLFSKVRYYLKLSQELQAHLSKYPDDWIKYQSEFIQTIDKIYQDILQFEKNNINELKSKVDKLKKRFEERYRTHFLYGDFIRWSFEKPFGYPGDFKIIDDIYQNQPRTTGFDRLWDNYFQQLDICKATRERKEDLKKIIVDFVKSKKNKNIRIMNLAFGPGREIKELLEADSDKKFLNIIFDCYDSETKAIDYAGELLNNNKNVNLFRKNAIRLALKKDVTKDIPWNYDLIYSAGLFDYLNEKVAIRLIGNLKKLLKEDGVMVIYNVRDRYSNPSVAWMEWVAEWYLVYRTEAEFKKIFLDGGLSSDNLKIIPQHSKVMQYCFASIH